MGSSSIALEKTGESRGFPWRSVALSLAAHALLLAACEPPSPAADETVRTLHASLQPPSKSMPVPPASRPARTEPEPGAHRTPREVAPGVAATAIPVAVSPAPTFDAQATGEVPAPQIAAVPAAVPVQAGSLETGVADAAGLRQYRLALAREARPFRRYPEAARRAEITGTVEVRIAVAADGVARQTELHRSSGHAALDAAALEMLRRAAERAEPPKSLRGQGFAVLLPVAFEVGE